MRVGVVDREEVKEMDKFKYVKVLIGSDEKLGRS